MRKAGKQEKKVSVPVFLLSSFKAPPDQTCPPRAETRPAHVAVMSAESPTRRLPEFPSLGKSHGESVQCLENPPRVVSNLWKAATRRAVRAAFCVARRRAQG